MKQKLIANIYAIKAASETESYNYEVVIKEWNSNGKSRTYFSIVETRENSKHYKKLDYGYYDNVSGEYFPNKYENLEKRFTFSGASF